MDIVTDYSSQKYAGYQDEVSINLDPQGQFNNFVIQTKSLTLKK